MSLVTIILPAFNAEKTIARAIQSALSQEYSNLEVIVIDDGSTDSTFNICQKIALSDKRLKVIHTTNSGPSSARNKGLQEARGQYICFLDADDEMQSEMVELLVQKMRGNIDLVACGYRVKSSTQKHTFEKVPEAGVWNASEMYAPIEKLQDISGFNPLWNKIFRLSIIRENNIKMNLSVSMGEDFLFVSDYISCCSGKIVLVDDVLYTYFLSKNSLQTTANSGADRITRDFEQLDYLKQICAKKHYPLRLIYKEECRKAYTALLLSENIKRDFKYIESMGIVDEFEHIDRSYGIKFYVFALLAKARSELLISVCIRVFRFMKQLTKTSFIW